MRSNAGPTVSRSLAISRVEAEGEHDVFDVSPDVGSRINRMQGAGQALPDQERQFFETRMGYDFGHVRVHTDVDAVQTSRALSAQAFTTGHNIVFAEGACRPGSDVGRRLLAHELTHVVQQGAAEPASQDRNNTGLQRQADEEDELEVGGQLMLFPRWRLVELPSRATKHEAGAALARSQPGASALQRNPDACDTPVSMRKVISGKFEGGKTLDDYFPDLVGTKTWGSKDTAGTFDNGDRAGSSVQLIGEYASPCAGGGSVFSLEQSVTLVRLRADGKKLKEGGKVLEGQTLDDIARSGRDASKAPFRQEFGFAVSMADPISGIPYKSLKTYELEANLTTSLSGPGGKKSVNWGVTVEAAAGKVNKNEVR